MQKREKKNKSCIFQNEYLLSIDVIMHMHCLKNEKHISSLTREAIVKKKKHNIMSRNTCHCFFITRHLTYCVEPRMHDFFSLHALIPKCMNENIPLREHITLTIARVPKSSMKTT